MLRNCPGKRAAVVRVRTSASLTLTHDRPWYA
jgi:hypothetical protein